MARETKEQEQLSQPLQGEDAERLVNYVENPVAPEGHDDYLKQADQVFADIEPRQDSTS